LTTSLDDFGGATREQMITDGSGSDRVKDYCLDKGPLAWLYWLLSDIGFCRASNGLVALFWSDIKEYSEFTGLKITPETARYLIRLSRNWVQQTKESIESSCSAPYEPPKREIND
jgi:hypothetical protein